MRVPTGASTAWQAGHRFQTDAIGRKGVEELRVWDDSGTYRMLYIARFTEAVYVLHAFKKKARATSGRDLELARIRYAELRRGRHG